MRLFHKLAIVTHHPVCIRVLDKSPELCPREGIVGIVPAYELNPQRGGTRFQYGIGLWEDAIVYKKTVLPCFDRCATPQVKHHDHRLGS